MYDNEISHLTISIDDFEKKLENFSVFDTCKAKFFFLAIRDNLEDSRSEFENFVEGKGIIEFIFQSTENEENIYVNYAHIKGLDIDIQLEYDNFIIYAGLYIEKISKKLNLNIDIEKTTITSVQ